MDCCAEMAGFVAGAVAAGFLFKSESLSYQQGLFFLGIAVTIAAFCALLVRFPEETISAEDARLHQALLARAGAG